MKKIVLTFALAFFAFAANAQLVVSANIGGSMTSGNVNTKTHITLTGDSTYTTTADLEKTTNINLGAMVGYKFGKCQAGIAGSYNMYTIANQELDPTIIPMMSSSISYINTTGSMTSKGSVLTVAPYFRYNVIEAGDVAIFLELDLFYSKSSDPTVTAHVENKSTNPNITFEQSLDSTFLRPLSCTSMGAKVVPGMNWQLSKNCAIDLYFDVLALAYTTSTTVRMNNNYVCTFNGTTPTYSTTSVTSTTTQQQFGGVLTGSPLLTEQGVNNWVRVGFNFTF